MKYLCLLFLIPFVASAQPYYQNQQYNQLINMQLSIRYGWNKWDPNSYYGGTDMKTAGIDTLKRFNHKKTGKPDLVSTDIYDQQGRLATTISKRKRVDYTYSDTLLTEEKVTYSRGKSTSTSYRYDNGNLTAVQHFSNGKQVEQYRFEYTGDICSLREYTDMNHRKKHVYTIKNTVSDEGKILAAVYLVDGKTERTWDYSCNEKGIIVEEKKVEQSSFCTYDQQNNNGSYTVFTRTIRKGKAYLTEADYTADSVLLGWKEFLNDTILVQENLLTGNVHHYNVYSDKGKFRSSYESSFDDQHRKTATRWINKRQKAVSTTKIIYNEKGLISNISFLNRRKKYSEETFEYSFNTL